MIIVCALQWQAWLSRESRALHHASWHLAQASVSASKMQCWWWCYCTRLCSTALCISSSTPTYCRVWKLRSHALPWRPTRLLTYLHHPPVVVCTIFTTEPLHELRLLLRALLELP